MRPLYQSLPRRPELLHERTAQLQWRSAYGACHIQISARLEICSGHVPSKADHSYDTAYEKLKNWGFKRRCEICTHDHEASNKTKTKNWGAALLQEWDVAAKQVGSKAGLANMESLLGTIEHKTYTVSAAVVPRLTLWDPYLTLTRIYAFMEDLVKTNATLWPSCSS